MARRYQVGWRRFIPFLGFHHILMLINLCAIVFWSFLLAACTSSDGIKDIYLLSLNYQAASEKVQTDPLMLNANITKGLADQVAASNKTVQQIRVGYISMCVGLDSGIWSCSNSAEELAISMNAEGNGDPLNLLRLAQGFRTGVVFFPLIIIAIAFTVIATVLLSTFPGWHEEEDSNGSELEVKPFPSRPVSQLALVLMFVASALGFASAFWQHIASAEASTLVRLLTYDMAHVQVGATAMVFGWLGATAASITMMGLLILILAIRVLQQLTD